MGGGGGVLWMCVCVCVCVCVCMPECVWELENRKKYDKGLDYLKNVTTEYQETTRAVFSRTHTFNNFAVIYWLNKQCQMVSTEKST